MTSYGGPDGAETTLDDTGGDHGDAWPPGTRLLGTYEITGAPRHGGMGVIHPARHLGWNTTLAVKSPRRHLLSSAADREDFVREARTWADLGLHPNICACHYVRTVDGFPRVFAEWVDRGSLEDRMRGAQASLYRGGPQVAVPRVLDIAIQTAWGLEHAHAQGVVHRDVKPGNILVGDEQQVKVTDFGLAQATRSHRGTPRYRSPEQAAGQRTGPATDVWSLAVVVLEMFTGECTWLDGSAAGEALADRVGSGAPMALPMPEGLRELLERCLAHESAERPARMADVAAELAAVHARATGEPYGRQPPVASRLRAAELNNLALSRRDLGQDDDEVRNLLREALAADPRHPEASYNLGMISWRAGETTPTQVLDELRSAFAGGNDLPGSAGAEHDLRVRHLMALVDAERGQSAPAVTIPVVGDAMAAVMRPLPDGKHVLVGHDDGRLTLHATDTGDHVRTFPGHAPHQVNALHVSRDGRHAVSSGSDRVVRVWDLATGARLGAKKRRGPVAYLTVAADQQIMALQRLAEEADRIRIWRLGSRRPRPYVLTLPREAATSPLFLDEDTVLAAEEGGAVGIWDWRRGRRLGTLAGHTGSVRHMAADRTGRLVVTAAEEGDLAVRVWDIRARRCLHRLEGHRAPVSALTVSADGRLALTGDGGQAARLWDLGAGTCLRELTGHTEVVDHVALAADRALTIELAGPARVWDVATGRCLNAYDQVDAIGAHAELTADGRYLLQAGLGRVVVRDLSRLPDASPLQICRPRSTDTVFSADRHSAELLKRAARARDEGDTAAALGLLRDARSLPGHERSPEAMARWREMASSTRPTGFRAAWLSRRLEAGDQPVQDVRTTPDGRLALTGGHRDHCVWVWDLAAGRRVGRLTGHTGPVHAVCVTPDGRHAVTASADRTARVWDLTAREWDLTAREWDLTALTHGPADLAPRATLTGHSDAVLAVGVTPDGGHAVTGGADGTVRVWDLRTGAHVRTMTGHRGPVNALCVTSDGRHVLSAGRLDAGVRQWDLSNGDCVRVPETYPGGGPVSMCLTPDEHLVTATWLQSQGGVRVRHLPTGRFLHRLGTGAAATNLSAVHSVPVGGFVLTAGSDHVLRLWDVASGRSVGRLEGHRCEVNAVHMTADWQHVLAAGQDGDVHVWDVDWELAEHRPA